MVGWSLFNQDYWRRNATATQSTALASVLSKYNTNTKYKVLEEEYTHQCIVKIQCNPTFPVFNLQAVLQKKTDIEAKILGQNFNQLRDWRSEMAKKSSHMLLSGTLSGILKSNPDLTTAITRPPW